MKYGWFVFFRVVSTQNDPRAIGAVGVVSGPHASKRLAAIARARHYRDQDDEPNRPHTDQYFVRKTAPGRTTRDICEFERSGAFKPLPTKEGDK